MVLFGDKLCTYLHKAKARIVMFLGRSGSVNLVEDTSSPILCTGHRYETKGRPFEVLIDRGALAVTGCKGV